VCFCYNGIVLSAKLSRDKKKGRRFLMARVYRNKIESELVATGKPEDSLESVDSMLRRFKKLVMNQEILLEHRKREFFVKKNKRMKEKSKLAKLKDKFYRDK
jgi:ribosomal protein S21